MSRFNTKPPRDAAMADAPLSALLAEMIGLGQMFSGQASWAMMPPPGAAANHTDRPSGMDSDDLLDNVPI